MVGTSAAPSTAPLRVGVVGCGAVAERYHLPALLASDDVDVVACVDPAIERARTLATRVGAREAFSDHRELVNRVDLAVVAVPNAFHAAVAVDLLQAGVNVLVEKPMARSVEECDQMLASAAGSGAVLAVGHDFRHYPVARFARGLLAGGLLGPVLDVEVQQSAGAGWPAVSTAILSAAAGGGVLIDFGVHVLDLLRWWVGDMSVVSYRDDARGGVEAECAAELVLASGAPVRLELSRTRTLRDTAVITCERGSVELGVFDPAVVRITVPGAGPALLGEVADQAFDRAPGREVFARQLADVVAAVRGEGEPLVGGRDGRAVVALVEACYAHREPLRLPWDYPEAYASSSAAGSL
ncbi:MAG: Gfo/Idh/MocA family protein [Janthinobacterium lividum]